MQHYSWIKESRTLDKKLNGKKKKKKKKQKKKKKKKTSEIKKFYWGKRCLQSL